MKRDVGSRFTTAGALVLSLAIYAPSSLLAQAPATGSALIPPPPGAPAQPPAAAPPSPAPAPAPAPPPAAPPPAAEVPPPAAAAPAASAQPPAAEPVEEPLDWDLGHRRYASWNGPTGGLYLLDGRAGEPGAVRVQLGLDAFSGKDFLQNGDKIEVAGQTLALSITAHKNVEFFTTLANRSTSQTRGGASSLDALGDITLGAKFGGKLSNLIDVGADLRGIFPNKAGGGGFDWGATSLWLRSGIGFDFQSLPKPVPFISRVNVGYLFDNSAQLVSDVEQSRYERLSSGTPKADETRHLVSRFERLGAGINRLDRLTFGVGFEAPLRLADRFYLHPIAEWQLGVPVNRQNFDCPYVVGTPNIGTPRSGEDSCYERDPGVVPMNLALAVRVAPPVRGLSALLGVDIGLTGSNKFVRELMPNQPWRVLFALSYDYDARPQEQPVATAPVAATPFASMALRGRVEGIVSTSDGTPIADARVNFLDRTLTSLATGPDGRFTTEALDPGPVSLQATHPDYEPGTCSAVIAPSAADVGVRCTLMAKPLIGKVQGQLLDGSGNPVSGARVQLIGPSSTLLTSDARGAFSADNLSPGTYLLRIEAGGYFMRQVNATIEARNTALVNATLLRKPITPTIQVKADAIVAPGIKYSGESTELDAAGLAVVAEIADLLLSRSDLYLQIQGYGATDAVAMTRAYTIKQRLVEAGVPEIRIEAVGGAGRTSLKLVLHH